MAETPIRYLASDVNSHGVGELEGVEESVGDDCGPRVSAPHLHVLWNHFGTEDAAVLVGQLDGPVAVVGGLAGLDPHVEFTWKMSENCLNGSTASCLFFVCLISVE